MSAIALERESPTVSFKSNMLCMDHILGRSTGDEGLDS